MDLPGLLACRENESVAVVGHYIGASDACLTVATRSDLVEWIQLACQSADTSLQALFVAVQIMDRYLAKRDAQGTTPVVVIAATAWWLGAKMEDVVPPSLEIVAHRCGVQNDVILRLEGHVLRTLEYRLAIPTPLALLDYFASELTTRQWRRAVDHLVHNLREYEHLVHSSFSVAACAATQALNPGDVERMNRLCGMIRDADAA